MPSQQYPHATSFSLTLTNTDSYIFVITMANLFNATISKFRSFFGSGQERNVSPSPGDQSADKPSQLSLNQEASVSKDYTLEYDDYSVNTMLPSYGEATTVLENAANQGTDMPCLCVLHQGCCRMHNSLRTPNRDLLDQPGILSRMVSNTLGGSGMEAKDFNAKEFSSLTLTPIHATMRYHLSMDHLECVRRQLDPRRTTDVITSLSYEEKCVSKEINYYDWLSDIYFRDGTFLQRQQMQCYLGEGTKKSEYFAACPHQSLCISPPEFVYKDGMLEAQTCVTNQPPRCASHPMEKWNSSQGRYAQIVVCTICHSDAECTLELYDRQILIRYTCYRDLGSGTSPSDPKWLSLLTGEGSPHRKEHELKLYSCVWNTAVDLRRNSYHYITHLMPNGRVFNARDERYRLRE